jgi:hypothetical protein
MWKFVKFFNEWAFLLGDIPEIGDFFVNEVFFLYTPQSTRMDQPHLVKIIIKIQIKIQRKAINFTMKLKRRN